MPNFWSNVGQDVRVETDDNDPTPGSLLNVVLSTTTPYYTEDPIVIDYLRTTFKDAAFEGDVGPNG